MAVVPCNALFSQSQGAGSLILHVVDAGSTCCDLTLCLLALGTLLALIICALQDRQMECSTNPPLLQIVFPPTQTTEWPLFLLRVSPGWVSNIIVKELHLIQMKMNEERGGAMLSLGAFKPWVWGIGNIASLAKWYRVSFIMRRYSVPRAAPPPHNLLGSRFGWRGCNCAESLPRLITGQGLHAWTHS